MVVRLEKEEMRPQLAGNSTRSVLVVTGRAPIRFDQGGGGADLIPNFFMKVPVSTVRALKRLEVGLPGVKTVTKIRGVFRTTRSGQQYSSFARESRAWRHRCVTWDSESESSENWEDWADADGWDEVCDECVAAENA